ncbi:MAG: MBG domain-containing protein [Phycisphaerae bacterium]
MNPLNSPPVVEALEPRFLMSASSAPQPAALALTAGSPLPGAVSVGSTPVASATWQVGNLFTGQLSGTIKSATDARIVSVVAKVTGTMRLSMSRVGSGNPLVCDLSVLNSSGGLLLGSYDSTGAGGTSLLLNIQAGKSYLIKAAGHDGTTGAFLLQASVDDYGNGTGVAYAWNLNTQGAGALKGRIEYAGDIDVFAIKAAATRAVQVNMARTSGSITPALVVVDANGTVLARDGNVAGASAGASFNALAGATYYVKAFSHNAGTGAYSLSIPVDDYGNTRPTAGTWTLGGGGAGQLRANINYAGDWDVLAVAAPLTGTMQVSMARASGSITPGLLIMDADGAILARDSNVTGANTSVGFDVQAGATYYVRAASHNASTGLYNLAASTQVSPPDPAPAPVLTITAGNYAMVYGSALPTLTASYSGFVNGDTADGLTVKPVLSTTASAASPVGTYAVTVSGAVDDNYTITYVAGTLTITPAPLTITADDKTMVCGDPLPALTASYAGFVNGDTPASLSAQPVLSTTASASSPAGTYAITASGAADANYTITYVAGAMTVTPAPDPGPVIAPVAAVAGYAVQTPNGLQFLVLGTDGADTITLSQTGTRITLTTSAGSQDFAGSFFSLDVYGFGGNDVIRLTSSVTVGATVRGGTGNDQIFAAGQGADTLYAGDGNTLLVSIGGGNDTLVGGAGLVSFWADSTDTLLNVTAAETSAKSVHLITSFYQPYTTDPSAPGYVSTTIAGQNFQDPTLGSGATGYMNYASSPLFADGPQYNDIRQGQVGDCYLLAALASLADRSPMVINQMITSLGDGTYAVRFYRDGQEVYLRLDADLPVNGSSLSYAKLSPQGETWVPLVEKAYAYFRTGANSYPSVEGGWPGSVFTAVAGGTYEYRDTIDSGVDLAGYISTHLGAGHGMTAISGGGGGPVVGDHVYMVQCVETTPSGIFVTVYNPWGYDGASYDSNPNDGLLRLSIDMLGAQFMTVAVSMA